MNEDPRDLSPTELVAVLSGSSDEVERVLLTRPTMVRLGWMPTTEQRRAATHAGFTLLGPGEALSTA